MSATSTAILDPVALLQALIRIPSPNPPGDTQAIASYVGELLTSLGCDVRLVAPPQKPEAVSAIGVFGSGDPVIMFHAHIDTVPIAADEASRWSVDPYGGEIRDGKIYGKGSIDDKAPLAAMISALSHAVTQKERFHGTLVIVAAAEEEVGGQLGTKWMAENGHLPQCDFIVVGEQTGNKVANAHKGVMRATVRAVGRSVHATNPDRGINAIAIMARAVLALEAYHLALADRVHPTVGVPTCNVGVIVGGSTANAVPDTCTAYLDRRMIPGEDPKTVKCELQAVIAGVDLSSYSEGARLTISDFLVSNWYESTVQSRLARQFLTSVRDTLNDSPGPIGYLPGSDAKHLVSVTRGEMIIFGPGSYEVAHAFDEYTRVDDLQASTTILRNFIDRAMLNGDVS